MSSLLYKYFVFILYRYIVLCVDIQCLCYVGIIGMEAAMMILWKQCRCITDIIPIISIIGDTTQISGTLASRASNEDFTITERLDSKRLLALPHLRHYQETRPRRPSGDLPCEIFANLRLKSSSYCCSRRYWHNILI